MNGTEDDSYRDVLIEKQYILEHDYYTGDSDTSMHAAKFFNLKRAIYVASVTPVHAFCEESNRCQSNRVPFSLDRDLVVQTPFLRGSHVKFYIALVALLLLGILLAALVLFWYVRIYRRKLRRQLNGVVPCRSLHFERRPKVFFIYTDDCLEHRKTVSNLAEYLRNNVNCEVFFDDWLFNDASFVSQLRSEPEWVLKCMHKCDYYLIIFSAGSKAVLESSAADVPLELKPLRTWFESFNLAITCVLEYVAEQTRLGTNIKLNKIVCCWFNYENECSTLGSTEEFIPESFRVLPCSKYKLISDLPSLTRHVHQLPECYSISLPGLNELENQMRHTAAYFEANPNWLQDRLWPVQTDDRRDMMHNLDVALANLKRNALLSASQYFESLGENGGTKEFGDDDYPLVPHSEQASEKVGNLDETATGKSEAEFELLPEVDSNDCDYFNGQFGNINDKSLILRDRKQLDHMPETSFMILNYRDS